jgi:cyclomaltodextrin glucanotransferase
MQTPQSNRRPNHYYGTLEPFVSEAVYQVLTDRFVDGDPDNNHEDQGGTRPTWKLRLDGPSGEVAYAGYTGGDFKGLHLNGDYIQEMGFTAVCISPIVDNPDESFTTDDPHFQVRYGANIGIDGGKAGYHGYWGVNFFHVDEHLESPDLSFQEFTAAMQSDHNLKIVLDIVANHGSPAWSMTVDQPKFGKVIDESGNLIADHQNLQPSRLDPENNTLHRFYNNRGANLPGEWDERMNLARLSDFNEDNPQVLDYLVSAYLKWIGQGAYAFRVDTIAWMPHAFWKKFSDAIRERYPGFFMYAEHFTGDTARLAAHQRPENGAISVLDFAGSFSIKGIFENPGSDYSAIQGYLHLEDETYINPYELAVFYDNHDMTRMNASDEGFIDANNWLFTTRGFPVVYYGSEMGFQRGLSEHFGNRNPYGPENIERARSHVIHQNLSKVAHLRQNHRSLQRGLQVNLVFDQNIATFLRVYQFGDEAQTALVLLNKGDEEEQVTINRLLNAGNWIDAETGDVSFTLQEDSATILTAVPAHGLKVYVFNEAVNNAELIDILNMKMQVLSVSHSLRSEGFSTSNVNN